MFGLSGNMRSIAVLLAIIVLTPGCILDSIEDTDILEPQWGPYSETSNVTLNIYHGETLESAEWDVSIRIMLNHTASPDHADNFRKHVMNGNYNNSIFHRIIDDFMVQGGDFQNHDGTGGYAADWYGVCNGDRDVNRSACPSQVNWNVPDEADNGLFHYACTISMAKTSQPDTGGSQFFMMPDDIGRHGWLDGIHTVFGVITEGCEHVTTMSQVATDSNDRPIVPVVIYGATAEA